MPQLINAQPDVYKQFVQSQQDKLNLITSRKQNNFNEDFWQFSAMNYHLFFDFSIYENDFLGSDSVMKIVFNRQFLSLSKKELAKVLWLDSVTGFQVTSHVYRSNFNCLCLLFFFLNEEEITTIKDENLQDLFAYMLTFDITPNGIKKRISPPSYGIRIAHFHIDRLARILRKYQVHEIVENFPKNKIDTALNKSCLSIMDITLTDYKEGGSFNFLGLEVGQHYIDHCGTVFEKHFQYATAVRQTMDVIVDEIRNKTNLFHEGNITNSAAGVLTGNFVEDHDLLNYRPLSSESLRLVRDITLELFIKHYNQLSGISQLFKLDTVNQIIVESGLPDRFDSQEFVRSLLIGLFIGHFEKRPELIFHEYVSAIESEGHVFKFFFDEFCDLSHSIVNSKSHKLTSNKKSLKKFLSQAVKNAPKSTEQNKSYPHAFQRRLNSITSYVESAGIVLFLGLTGWRKSEFGFPISSIEVSINNDVLDNLYTPWRFHVKWLAPKTSGSTPLQREITSYAYQIAFLMDKLNLSDSNKPALYLPGPQVKKYWNSADFFSNRVDLLWDDFVENYSIFTDLNNIETLSKKAKLNNSEKTSLKTLRQKYDLDSSQVKTLIQMKERLEKSLPRFQLGCGTDGKSLGKRLKKYLAGELEDKFVNILEESISPDTLEKIKSGEFELNATTTRYVRNELLANDVYPTPHAFRHIWAEAVLLRYRGDVGKFIRANFKHLDERFFMSYLRNKETKAVYQVAKRTIINSIVRQQIMTITDNSREFAGGFDRFLSKAVKFTKVVTPEQLEDLASMISEQRVIDIKSNPWATCILRVGTEKTAKCSEDGVPQRRNAEPKLCLGCVNADIADGNFNGIVVYIKYDIAACRNPRLPAFIKEPHIQTVRIALKRVEELRRNSNNPKYNKFISYLHETLEMSSLCTEIA